MNNKEKDNIKPDHYGGSEIDVIDFCQANNLDFMQGNVIKYITRYRKKNGLEDIRKAVEYINRILADEYPEYEAIVRRNNDNDKEMQLLKSKMQFYKTLINELDSLNFITKSNNFDKKIKDYQDELAEIYKRVQELKKEL